MDHIDCSTEFRRPVNQAADPIHIFSASAFIDLRWINCLSERQMNGPHAQPSRLDTLCCLSAGFIIIFRPKAELDAGESVPYQFFETIQITIRPSQRC